MTKTYNQLNKRITSREAIENLKPGGILLNAETFKAVKRILSVYVYECYYQDETNPNSMIFEKIVTDAKSAWDYIN